MTVSCPETRAAPYLCLEGVVLAPLVVRPAVVRISAAVSVGVLRRTLDVGVLEVVALVALLSGGGDGCHHQQQDRRMLLHSWTEMGVSCLLFPINSNRILFTSK